MTKNYLYLEGTRQTEELRRKLENKKTIPHTTLEDEYWESEILERIAIPQSGMNNKIFILEKVRHPNNEIQLRFGYWIIGKRGRKKNRWSWGQFAPFIPSKDFEKIVSIAKEKEFI